MKSWLIRKDPDTGRDWGQEEKGTTEDEMAGWHHRLDGCEFEWTPGVGDGQGGLVCCDSWSRKESDTTEQLNWTELIYLIYLWSGSVVEGMLGPVSAWWGRDSPSALRLKPGLQAAATSKVWRHIQSWAYLSCPWEEVGSGSSFITTLNWPWPGSL